MTKFALLVLCAVAVCLDSVYAGPDERAAFHAAIKPVVTECGKEHGVSEEDVHKVKTSGNLDDIKPCFVGCVFKKIGIINSKGEYEADDGLAKIKSYVKNDDMFAKLTEVANQCKSVNDKPVSDGDAGCERAVLLAKCFMEHKSEMMPV